MQSWDHNTESILQHEEDVCPLRAANHANDVPLGAEDLDANVALNGAHDTRTAHLEPAAGFEMHGPERHRLGGRRTLKLCGLGAEVATEDLVPLPQVTCEGKGDESVRDCKGGDRF